LCEFLRLKTLNNIMDFYNFIQQHANFITIILGAIGAIILTWKQLKAFIVKKYKERREYIKSRDSIPTSLNKIADSVNNIDTRLKNVEYEISPNGGGSMKDSVKIIKAEIEAMFWLNPHPSFRTTYKGLNIMVNQAYCNLCGTSSEELLKLNWKNFIEDENQLDDYMRRWDDSTEVFSQFSGKLKFKNSKGDYTGEWIVKVRPLGAIDSGNDFLWHGTIYPFDQKSKEYAKSYSIPVN
jgi:PAS domain-containing protein